MIKSYLHFTCFCLKLLIIGNFENIFVGLLLTIWWKVKLSRTMSNVHRSFYTFWCVNIWWKIVTYLEAWGRSGPLQRCLVRNGLSMTLSILAAALCCHRRKHHRHNLQVVLLWVFGLYIGIIGIKNPTNINMILNIIRVRIPEWIPHHTTPHDQLEARCGEISRFLFLHHHLWCFWESLKKSTLFLGPGPKYGRVCVLAFLFLSLRIDFIFWQ